MSVKHHFNMHDFSPPLTSLVKLKLKAFVYIIPLYNIYGCHLVTITVRRL